MSLVGALNVSKTALAVHQAAIQVTSSNIANAGNPDYTRQTATITSNPDQQLRPGVRIGTGINLSAIQRQIDEALEGRIRASVSDSEGAGTEELWLGRMEAVFHELGDDDLSTHLSTFFNAWSNLANDPDNASFRQIVLRNGETLAGVFREMRDQLASLRADVDDRMKAVVAEADAVAGEIADLNQRIVIAEGAAGASANALRDQRDALLKKLSGMIDITTINTLEGTVNVMMGSEPLVIGVTNRGIMLEQKSVNGQLTAELRSKTDGAMLPSSSGTLGALVEVRAEIDGVMEQVDDLAGNLIFELNKLHTEGQGLEGFSKVTGSFAVADTTAALNSAAADLDFTPKNGTFDVTIHQPGGIVTTHRIQMDLDGLGTDTTLDSLRADLDAIDGISATFVGGKLSLTADSAAIRFSFKEDTSGALAALGINTFFTGSDALDIAVNANVRSNLNLLAAATNGQSGDNTNARRIAELESKSLQGLNGSTLKDSYASIIDGIAVGASSARRSAAAARVVHETLVNQREALSGVSLDEEAINLMRQQRAFQGAARVISAVDELMKTLLSLV
jgi:flagellar hook-associated protein 1 FlgK